MLNNLIADSLISHQQAGLSIVELHSIKNGGVCGCGNTDCQLAGKHPKYRGWQNYIGNKTPYDNLKLDIVNGGKPTGFGFLLESHHLIVDVDPKNGGLESYKRLCDIIPELENCNVGAKSGGGGFHLYYTKPDTIKTMKSLRDFKGIDFLTKGAFVVASGSLHKSGGYYTLDYGFSTSLDEIGSAPAALIQLIERKPPPIQQLNGYDGDINDLLDYVPNKNLEYDEWLNVGMAIHHTNNTAFSIWDNWSKTSDKYTNSEYNHKKWLSFGKTAGSYVTVGTLIKMAYENGYVHSLSNTTADIDQYFESKKQDSVFNKNELLELAEKVDIRQPHGLIGDIVEYINRTAFKQRPLLAVASALWTMSCVMNRLYIAPLGGKLSLYCMGIAASGSGKDHPYAVAKELLIRMGYAKALNSEMASDVDMHKSLYRNQIVFYAIDEAHKIFNHIDDAKANTYIQKIAPAMLNLKTDKVHTIRHKDQDSFKENLNRTLDRIEKHITECDAEKEKYWSDYKIRESKKKSYIEQGIINPILNIYATSTPAGLDNTINIKSIATGLIGRFLIFKETDNTPPPLFYGVGDNNNSREEIPNDIINKLDLITQRARESDPGYNPEYGLEFWGTPYQITCNEHAKSRSVQIHKFFEQCAENADENIQPLYMRAFEHTVTVASLIAAYRGEITEQDIIYAFALIQNDIQTKILMSIINKGAPDTVNEEDRQKAVKASIIQACDKEEGEVLSKIKRAVKKYKMDDKNIKDFLDNLTEAGYIISIVKNVNGRTFERFKLKQSLIK